MTSFAAQSLRRTPLQWEIVAVVKALNVVAIEALVADLHPGAQRAYGRQLLDGKPDRLRCGHKAAIAQPLSLETPIGDEEDSHLGDFIEDTTAILPIDAAIQSNLRETTTRVLAFLTPREERIIRMRFGIGMNKDHTLEEVGQQFSVTRERIRQIEAKALRKLKHPSRSRKLRSFLDN